MKPILLLIIAGLLEFFITSVVGSPTIIGSWPGHERCTGQGHGMVLSGERAFWVCTEATIGILDLNNSIEPRQAGLADFRIDGVPGTISNFRVSGSKVYVSVSNSLGGGTAENSLGVLDISEVYSPVTLGSYTSTDNLFSGYSIAAVHDDVVYVRGRRGLEIIGFDNPSEPTRLGHGSEFDSIGPAEIVRIGNSLYMVEVDGVGGLVIIDVTNPAQPSFAGTYIIGSEFGGGLAVVGTHAYVGSREGLRIFDISNANFPQLLKTDSEFASGYGALIAVENNLFLKMNDGHIILDLANPASPQHVGTVLVEEGTILNGSFAIGFAEITGESTSRFIGIGQHIINISDPPNSIHVPTIYPPELYGSTRSVSAFDKVAYLVDSTSVEIVDVNEPASPVHRGSIANLGSPTRVAIQDGYAFISDWAEGLHIVDVSTATNPVYVANYLDHSSQGLVNAQSLAVEGTHCYVADIQRGLRIVDISDPTNPVLKGGYKESFGQASDVVVRGDYAYVAYLGAGLRIVNVATPAASRLVGSYHGDGNDWFASHLTLSGNLLFMTDGLSTQPGDYRFQIIDITDPSSPTPISRLNTGGPASSIAVWNDQVFLGERYSGLLRVVDVSDPLNPNLIGTHAFPGNVSGIAVDEYNAYLATESWGLNVFQIAQPPPSFSLIHPTGANTPFGFDVTGESGTIVDIEARESLNEGTWEKVGSITVQSGGSSFEDMTPSLPSRFYRLKPIPD